jgi:flagellar hook assembly protein FlgD
VQEKLKGLLPTRFELLANYPNPFNPSTTLPIAIPIKSEVTLDVYNVLGQHVKRLMEGPLEPGRYYFEWDGSNDAGAKVASGVYFGRLRANGHSDFTNKMLLLR